MRCADSEKHSKRTPHASVKSICASRSLELGRPRLVQPRSSRRCFRSNWMDPTHGGSNLGQCWPLHPVLLLSRLSVQCFERPMLRKKDCNLFYARASLTVSVPRHSCCLGFVPNSGAGQGHPENREPLSCYDDWQDARVLHCDTRAATTPQKRSERNHDSSNRRHANPEARAFVAVSGLCYQCLVFPEENS